MTEEETKQYDEARHVCCTTLILLGMSIALVNEFESKVKKQGDYEGSELQESKNMLFKKIDKFLYPNNHA